MILYGTEITIEAQYTKDLSFENSLAPKANSNVPEISVDVTTGVRPIGDELPRDNFAV